VITAGVPSLSSGGTVSGKFPFEGPVEGPGGSGVLVSEEAGVTPGGVVGSTVGPGREILKPVQAKVNRIKNAEKSLKRIRFAKSQRGSDL
jgi:hypothetical protein